MGWRSCVGRAALVFALGAAGVLAASQSLQNAVANGDTRSLTIHHTHTGEDITITFKREGRYDDESLKKLNWFLRDWRSDQPTRMDPKLFDVVWEVYRETGGKQPIQIISAYRSPATNAMLRRRGRGVAQYSQHMLGRAMDFAIPGVPLEEIRAAGLRLQRGGVGFYPTSGSPFVHLDTGSVRHWPRMTRDQLARVFPNGRTVHLPTDGRPMAGYAIAMADVERRGGSVRGGVAETETETVDSGPRFGEKSKKFFAKLFGFRDEDEDATELSAASVKPAATPAAAHTNATPRIPLPPARPVERTAAAPAAPAKSQPGGFSLASATSTPVEVKTRSQTNFALASATSTPVEVKTRPQPNFALASATSTPVEVMKQSPADAVESRGMWRANEGSTDPQARPAAAPSQNPGGIGSNGTRFVWITGPQGRPLPANSEPRAAEPPAREKAGAIASDTTASVAPWPVKAKDPEQDRVPADVALAYAAEAAPQPSAPKLAPMGALRPAWQQNRPAAMAAQPAPSPASAATPAPVTAKAGQRYNDPWLRGVVMAPSVHYSMSVAVLGAVDYRSLRPYMVKPTSVVAMAFSADPNAGMKSLAFEGSAVNFVPLVTFGQQTAQLN